MAATDWSKFTPVNDGEAGEKPKKQTDWSQFTPVEPAKRTIASNIKDFGVTALKGAVGLPQAVVGIADIATGGHTGKALEGIGYKPAETQKVLDTWYSEPQQEANKYVSDAKGFTETLSRAIERPSVIGKTVIESAPQMIGGAGIARGLMKAGTAVGTKVAPYLAGAVGEGAMGAGSAASTIREESPDGLLTGKQSLSAAGSGLGTTAFGALGGKLAQKFNFGDIDTILTQGGPNAVAAGAAKKGFVRQMAEGGISEAVFEELPQSTQEQMWQNYALDKPLTEGVGNAAAMGLLAGAVTGGAGGGYNAAMSRPADTPAPAPLQTPTTADINTDTGELYTPDEITSFMDQQAANQATMQRDLEIERTMAAYDADLVETAKAQLGGGTIGRAASLGIDSGAIAPEQVLGMPVGLTPEQQAAADYIAAIDAGGIPLNVLKTNAIARNLGLEVNARSRPEETNQRIRDAVSRIQGADNGAGNQGTGIPAMAAQGIEGAGNQLPGSGVAAQDGDAGRAVGAGGPAGIAVPGSATAEPAGAVGVADQNVSRAAASIPNTGTSVPNTSITRQPLAESQAPSTSEQGDAGVAPGQAGGTIIARVGTTPNSTEPVTVRDGVVYLGNYPAQDFETGDDITVANADFATVSKALKDAGALSSKQRIYQGEKGMRQAPKAAEPVSTAINQNQIDNETPATPATTATADSLSVAADNKPARPKQSKLTPLTDQRLADPAFQSSLPRYAEGAGWAEEGGKLLRDANGDAAGRTSWAPKADWWQGKPLGVTEKLVKAGVAKAVAGENMPMAEKNAVMWLLDVIEQDLGTQIAELEAGLPSAAETLAEVIASEISLEGMTFDEETDTLPELGAQGMNEADAMRALGFTEDEINETTGKHRETAEGTDTGTPQEGAESGAAEEATGGNPAQEGGTAEEGVTPEQAIRAAFRALPSVTLGSWHPITVTAGGRTQKFLANQARTSDGKTDAAIHLLQIRRGRMLASMPVQDIAYRYKLTGKNELVEEGIPTAPTELQQRKWENSGFSETAEAFALNQQTPAEAKAKEEAEQKAAAKAEREASKPTGPDVTADQVDMFNTQDGLFNSNRDETVQQPAPFTEPEQPVEANKAKPETKQEAAPEAADYADRIYTLAVQKDLFDRLYTGDVTADEFKAAFNGLQNNKAGIVAELSAMTKDGLFKEFPWLSYRYKNYKKADIVEAAYRGMSTQFVLGDTLSYGMGKNAMENAVRAIVEKTTDADLAKFAEDVKKSIAERKARNEEVLAGMDDPQTLEDFNRLLRARREEMGGATFTELRMSLTPEQRAQYDILAAEKSRGERVGRRDDERTRVQAAGATTGAEIIATKHTRDGYDLFVVKAAERVERDVYNAWNAAAKKLGGWYSAFKGNGAIPGFQFKDRESAEAFQKYVSGNDTQAVQDQAKARRDAFADDRSQTAVERLNEMADSLEEKADASLGQERKANTARRARFAASAEAAASAEKAMAQTMRNIANAISDGTVKFLDRIRQKVQIETLQGFVTTAQYEKLRKLYPSYSDYERHQGERPNAETADYVEFPSYTAYRSDLAGLGRALLENEGTKKLGQKIMKVADDVSGAYLKFAKENLDKVSSFRTKDGGRAAFPSKAMAEAAIQHSGYKGAAIVLPVKRNENVIILSPSEAIKRGVWTGDNDKRITLTEEIGAEIVEKLARANNRQTRDIVPWQFNTAHDKLKRLAGMGIETPAELRAAVREFIGLREAPKEADKIKQMEREMIGRRNDGLDFFPTPASTVDEMIEAAGIQEGMSVLEPSAGMGHIAERIREAGADPDVVELSNERKELLEAKGFNVVGRDFMEVAEGQYDRILMNPPFGGRRDAEHVQHAYDLLKPGGRLVAIMGEGVFFGSDKKAQAFRDWLAERNGTDEKLDAGTFLDPTLPVNTGVSARMVVIDKPGPEWKPSPKDETDTAFVRAEVRTNGLTEDDSIKRLVRVQAVVNRIKANWKNAPEIIVVADMQDAKVPQQVRDLDAEMKSNGATGEPRGFISAGKVYIVAGQNKSVEDVMTTLAHETLGHAGLRGLYGDALNGILDQITNVRKLEVTEKAIEYGLHDVDGLTAETYAAMNAQQKAVARKEAFASMTQKQKQQAAEEVLANMAETRPEMGFVKRAIAAIRQWLRDNGLNLKLTDADIVANFILPVRDFIENGAKPMTIGQQLAAFSRASQTDSAAFRSVDVFGNGSRVDYYDDKKGLMYSAQRFPTGTTKWTVFETFPPADGGDQVLGEMFKYKSMEEAQAAVRGLRISATQKAKSIAKYGAIPNLWQGDEKKAAKALIDAGIGIDRFASSTQSRSKYIYLDSGLKIRLADHALPGDYDSPDIDYRYGGDIKALVEEVKNAEGAASSISSGVEPGTPRDGMLERPAVRADKSGSLEEPAQKGEAGGKDSVGKSGIESNGDFSPTNPDIMFSRTVELRAAVSQRAADLLTTQKTFNNWWHKTVGTQYHKAHVDADYRKAFNAVQSYLSGMAMFANSSADLADRLIPQLNSIRDLWNAKQPSQADIKAISAPIFAGTLADEKVYGADELRDRFKLTPSQIDLYVQFRAAVDKSLDDLGKTDILRYAGKDAEHLRDEIMNAATAIWAAIKVAAHLNSIGKEDDAKVVMDKGTRVADLKAKGYAPLTRFGRYTLYATRGDEQLYFSLFENEAEANARMREMKADPEFAGATFTHGVLSTESYKLFNGISPDTLELFADAMGVENNELVQEYIKLAKSNRSAMKRLIKRKGIAGFSEDVPRILASFITSNARQSASNVYGAQMDKAAEAIPKEKGDVKDEAIKMIDFARNPTEDAAKLRGMLFVQYIGGSVASAMVNLTQPLTMSYPYLHQFSKKAGVELAKAMKLATVGGILDPELKKALKRAEIDGVVSPQEIHQLQAEAVKKGAGIGALARMFGVKGDAANKLDDLSKRGLFAWGSLFSLAEQFNRRSTFIAAYNIARQNKQADPFAFAEKAVVETQGIYNRGNRPDWARGAPGALIFTFKQYGISYMEFLTRLPPKEKAIALAILVLAAGLQGLPFADDLDDLIDTLAQQMGYAWNTKAEKEKFAASILGQSGADFVLHGTSALPGFPLDFSARLGMSNLLPGTGMLLKNKTDKAGEVFDVLGPAGGVLRDALHGEFMPLAVRNALKAVDMANTGMYRDYSGKKVIETGGLDAATKFIGFNPAKVARESRAARMDMQDIQLARNIEAEIAGDMAQGVFTGDKEAVAKAREELVDWNAKNPDKPIVITSQQIMARVKKMAQTRRERLIKSAPKELRGGLVE